MTLTFLIDGVDYSSYIPRAYRVQYEPILGANTCRTLDGKLHEDILAYKARIEIELKPLTTAQLSAIAQACDNCQQVTYFDAKTNANVTKDAKATLSQAALIMNYGTTELWNNSMNQGIILTVEER